MPVSQYAAQGILTDLRPYIDADPELSGDHLMAHVLDAASIDGKLYQAFSSFSIASAIGLSKVVGEYDQWTLTEVKDALSKLKPGATVFSFDWTREQVLQSCFSRSYEAFIDWDTGKCSFDGQDFRELLEFVNSFPENFNYNDVDWSQIKYDVEALNAGDQLLIDSGLYSLDSYGRTSPLSAIPAPPATTTSLDLAMVCASPRPARTRTAHGRSCGRSLPRSSRRRTAGTDFPPTPTSSTPSSRT